MALKNFKPITPGQRGLVLTEKSELHKGKPEKISTVQVDYNYKPAHAT